jgi:methyl-accepting chemotaxis protein
MTLKLLAKFNLLLILLFGTGLLLVSQLSRRFLEENARDQTLQQAKLMISSARSTRDYTEQELDPLLEHTPDSEHRFLPQTIPFYAATVTFNHLRKDYPDRPYKEAALNPTNPRDRANQWEADIINYFRDHPDKKQLIGERQTATGTSISLSQPIAADASCLECHGSAAAAPPTEILTYGSANGFGWKVNEVIGAQIVSVPTAVAEGIASHIFHTLLLYISLTFIATLVVIDLGLYYIVIVPVRRLAATADLVSTGDLSQPELTYKGKDEIAEVTASFNRMYVSLKKAIQMLDKS